MALSAIASSTAAGDRQIIDFYRQHNLDYHQGLNNFLQTDEDRTGGWMDKYYTYLRQPLHSTPEHINTPQIQQCKSLFSRMRRAISFPKLIVF
jgi:hypothetical protein